MSPRIFSTDHNFLTLKDFFADQQLLLFVYFTDQLCHYQKVTNL